MDIRHAALDRLPVKQAGKPCVGFPALPVCGGWLIYEEGFYTSACMKMGLPPFSGASGGPAAKKCYSMARLSCFCFTMIFCIMVKDKHCAASG